MSGSAAAPEAKAARLPCWRGKVTPKPVSGGITNVNFVVADHGEKFFVRIGEDIPVHQIMRFNELAASRAAHAAGVSPEVVYAAPGVLVIRYVEGVTFAAADVRKESNLERIVALIKKCHREIPRYLRGPALCFWVFHVIRDYAATLREGSSRHAGDLPRYLDIAAELERAVGPIDVVFGHNDLLPANFIDDGTRMWLIDWDYAGFGSPLFDLGGLASNNELRPEQEEDLLERYFEAQVSEGLRGRYEAMKCASLLRESMWSMVSELHSSLDVDYEAYTAENLARFEGALTQLRSR